MSEKIMMIPGEWLSARSWENYLSFLGDLGYDVSAPEWPRKVGDVETLREDTSDPAGLGVAEIVDHYDSLIREMEQPPVLLGHSVGTVQ
jgi:pimeloyl-ACP methyl ester carboxylesterase